MATNHWSDRRSTSGGRLLVLVASIVLILYALNVLKDFNSVSVPWLCTGAIGLGIAIGWWL